MFQPNSIKTLKNLKVEKSYQNSMIERSNSVHNQNNPQDQESFNLEQLKDILSLSKDHPYNQLVDNKEMIIEVNSKIEDIRRWRENQKKELDQKLTENKNKLNAELEKSQMQTQKEDEDFNKFLDDLNQIQNKCNNASQVEISQINKSCVLEDKQSNEVKDKLETSTKKLDELTDLTFMIEKAMMELNAEEAGNKEKLQQELSQDLNKLKNIDSIAQGLGDWDSQLEQILQGYNDESKINESKQFIIQQQSQQKNNQPIKIEDEQYNIDDLQKDLDDINKEFEELDKIFSKN